MSEFLFRFHLHIYKDLPCKLYLSELTCTSWSCPLCLYRSSGETIGKCDSRCSDQPAKINNIIEINQTTTVVRTLGRV